MDKIKVFLVEDDPVWLDCLSAYIEQERDMQLVGMTGSREEAIHLYASLEVDVVLMDVVLTENNLDGLDAAAELLAIKPTKVIMLTSLDEHEVIMEAFTVGAVNYITKVHFKEIPDAIRDAYRNRASIHADVAQILRSEFSRLKREELQKLLTPAEKEILQLIGENHTKNQITDLLHIAQNTIKKHVSRIVKKLGVRTGKEAARKARRRGLFDKEKPS